jgi:hypothetical protein
MCFPIPPEIDAEIEENLMIYVCKQCAERSLMKDGIISIKALQPDGWGCNCIGNEFAPIELEVHGHS